MRDLFSQAIYIRTCQSHLEMLHLANWETHKHTYIEVKLEEDGVKCYLTMKTWKRVLGVVIRGGSTLTTDQIGLSLSAIAYIYTPESCIGENYVVVQR